VPTAAAKRHCPESRCAGSPSAATASRRISRSAAVSVQNAACPVALWHCDRPIPDAALLPGVESIRTATCPIAGAGCHFALAAGWPERRPVDSIVELPHGGRSAGSPDRLSSVRSTLLPSSGRRNSAPNSSRSSVRCRRGSAAAPDPRRPPKPRASVPLRWS
jgi:hypothetical protein